MNERGRFIAKSAAQLAATHLRRSSVAFWISSSSQGVRPPRRQQSASHQIQIGERERGVQSRGILRQAAVANFAKAPQTLYDVKDMLDAGARSRSAPVDKSLVLGQVRGAPVDPVTDALRQRRLPQNQARKIPSQSRRRGRKSLCLRNMQANSRLPCRSCSVCGRCAPKAPPGTRGEHPFFGWSPLRARHPRSTNCCGRRPAIQR